MKTFKKYILPLLFAAAITTMIGLSARSLNRYPPVSFDEVANSVMAKNFRETGTIRYTLQRDIVDDKFLMFAETGQDSLRGIYIGCLALIQKLTGTNPHALRASSLFPWMISGTLIFFITRRFYGIPFACLALLSYGTAFDHLIISHLVRPDAWIVCLALLITWIALFAKEAPVPWALAFFIGTISLGFHPHGLLIPFWTLFLWLTHEPGKPRRSQHIIAPLTGTLLGLGLCFRLADWESYFLNTRSFVMTLYQSHSSVWLERLLPWNLLGDTFSLLLQPQSFYFSADKMNGALLSAYGLAIMALLGLGCLDFYIKRPPSQYFTISLGGGLLMFVGIGFGHYRPEFIYWTLISIWTLPLAVTILAESKRDILEQFKALPSELSPATCWLTIGVITTVFTLTLLFQSNLVFILMMLLIIGGWGSPKRFGLIFLIEILIVGSLQIRNPEYLKSHLISPTNDFIGGPHYFTLFFLLIGLTVTFLSFTNIFRHRRWNLNNNILPSLLRVGMTLWYFSVPLLIAVYHTSQIHQESRPLIEDEVRQLKKWAGLQPVKWLGPNYYWYEFGDRYRDIGGVRLDTIYTGQKRPRYCIMRWKPDILITDEDFIRRYQYFKSQEQWRFISLSTLLERPTRLLGSFPSNAQHSTLYVHQITW
ncbi:MAG: hypothetical protein LHV69_04155 [Elusimicrobia bacterium]|nr:hypothetical protein [Candidatus Obscuribacterium magneticum]